MISKFYIQAKVAPNVWVPIFEISDALINFSIPFESVDDANYAKRDVKNYLKIHEPRNKVPIRVFEVKNR